MPGSFELKLSEMFNIAHNSVHTQADFAVLAFLSFKCQSKFVHENREPKCETFDSKYRDKQEPYVLTLQFTYPNYEMIQFNSCFRRFSNSAIFLSKN